MYTTLTFATENEADEGNGHRSLFIYTVSKKDGFPLERAIGKEMSEMLNETQLEKIKSLVNQVLEEMPDYFLVQVKIKPTNNVKVFLDGDQGIPIEACIKVNRKLYPLLETELYPEGDFSLEVSSPGVGEPLLMHRQYLKNKDRWVEVQTMDGKTIEGQLKEIGQESIVVESTTGKGKKAVTTQEQIHFNNIKTTTVQIKF